MVFLVASHEEVQRDNLRNRLLPVLCTWNGNEAILRQFSLFRRSSQYECCGLDNLHLFVVRARTHLPSRPLYCFATKTPYCAIVPNYNTLEYTIILDND